MKKSKILVVDDNFDNVFLIKSSLMLNDLETEEAYSGKEAIEKVLADPPDLILLDIMMPEMDGYEVCKILKDNEQTRHIPIMFITAKREYDDIVKGFKLGAVDYVSKPFNEQELFVRINNHLELKKSKEQIEEQNKELNRKNLQLTELNQTKDKFFSIVAHDLKNPFNTILGFAKLLVFKMQKYKPEQIHEFSKLIYDASEKGYKLLENLLEWSRSQTGRIQYVPEIINLAALADNTIDLFKGGAATKSISLSSDVAADDFAYGDEYMIKTILRNLVSNALKFTENEGSVSISTQEAGEDFIEVLVMDTGIGIQKEKREQLFNIGTHFSTKGTANESGTGLGLILCKEFVEKNGGTIRIESELKKGSTFIFSLPKKEIQQS
ncbi:MAG: hybrid sensor histidine kinase/response regulator [Bacteroidia bacterium]|nr:MAG: hybrid sensor histidine kinase/response regulator [Bacteroidia bacterium]